MSEELADYIIAMVAKRIAGDIVISSKPSSMLRKWRDYFEASQNDVAKLMKVSSSVISDYEKGRRQPGAGFIQRYVNALLELDRRNGYAKVSEIAKSMGIVTEAVIDMRDFSRPLTVKELSEALKGVLLTPGMGGDKRVYGYTIVDSIKAVLTMSGIQFSILFGGTPERAIVFTGVQMGRSPMVAVRVSPVKPGAVVIHGPRDRIDPLAIELAKRDGVPLILSLADSVDELVYLLKALASRAHAPVA